MESNRNEIESFRNDSKKTKTELLKEIDNLKAELEIVKRKNNNKNLSDNYPGLSLIKKYERILSESEEKYRLLFSKANDAIFITYRSIIKDCNDKCESLLNIKKEDLYGKSIYDFFPEKQPDGKNSIKKSEEYVELALNGKNQNFYWKLLKGNRQEFETEVSLSFIQAGNQKFIQIIVKDITEELLFEKIRKRSEELIKKQNQVLLNFANSLEIVSGNLPESFKKITKEASLTLDLERASIWIFDKSYSKIVCNCLYQKSSDKHFNKPSELKESEYPKYFKAIRNDRLLAVSDILNDERTNEFNDTYSIPFGVKSLLDVPIRFEGKIYGIICYEQVGQKRDWTIEEQNFAAATADILSIAIEANEKKKAETALKQSEERFRLLSESSPIGIFLTDESGVPVYINAKISEITGHEQSIFYVNQWFQIIYPQDFNKVAKTVLSALANHSNCFEEFRIVKKNGDIVWVRFNSSIIKGRDGMLIGWVGTIENISEQRNFMQRLKESEKRFRLLSETAIEGIMFTEKEVIVDVNDRFIFMHGYSNRDEVIGRKVSEFLVDGKNQKLFQNYGVKNAQLQEVKSRKKDGTVLIVELKGEEIPYYGKKIYASVLNDITEKRKYINAVKESERALSTLMNNLPGMVYRCANEQDWPFHLIGEGCFALTGYTQEDFLKGEATLYSSLIHKEDKSAAIETMIKAIKNKLPFEIEYRIFDKNGCEKWVWEKGTGIYNEDGDLLFIEGFITDITIRKEYDKLIRQSRESYKNLVENSPVGVIIIQNEQVVYANPTALKLFGLTSLEDISTFEIWDYITPEYHEITKTRIAQIRSGEILKFNEIKVRNRDGEILDIEVNGNIIDFYGKPALQTVLYDISYRKALQREQLRAQIAEETNKKFQKEISERISAQKKLIEIQKFTRSIISSSLDMICATDKHGNIIEFNEAAQRIFGYSIKDLNDKHPSVLYADYDEYLSVEKILNEKGHFSGEISNINKGGKKFTAYLSASILRNEEGDVIGSMGVSRDITEQKIDQKKIKDSLKEKEVLLQEVHHRVKNNLQVISSILNLQSSFVKEDSTLSILRESQNRIKAMAFIHESLYQTKDFSKINFSEYILNLSKNLVHSYGIFSDLIDLNIEKDEVYLNLDLAIPAGLIINELVSNSLKYAFPEKSRGCIYISIKEREGNVILIVKDNGVGLPPGIDIKNTETLGLQLVTALTEQINGKLTFFSGRNEGTSFEIKFGKGNNK